MSGQLCLRWNNHNTAFTKLLSQIHLEDMYSDGTILCQGKFYPVHRFVLSTCSEYFEKMFQQCIRLNNKHPFIIVKDIHPEQMEALLNYMYKGEVNVPQEMLPELIKAAEVFKIKGLAVPDEEPASKPSKKRLSPSSPSSVTKKSRRHDEKQPNRNKIDDNGEHAEQSNNWEKQQLDNSAPSTSSNQSGAEEIYLSEHDPPKIKSEPLDTQDHEHNPVSEKPSETGDAIKAEQDFEVYSGDDTNFENFDYEPSQNFDGQEQESASWDNSQPFEGEDDPGSRLVETSSSRTDDPQNGDRPFKYGCTFPGCYFQAPCHSAMKVHFRKHTGEKPFQCPKCSYRASRNASVNRHMKFKHAAEESYACMFCSFKTALEDSLIDHVNLRHPNKRLYTSPYSNIGSMCEIEVKSPMKPNIEFSLKAEIESSLKANLDSCSESG